MGRSETILLVYLKNILAVNVVADCVYIFCLLVSEKISQVQLWVWLHFSCQFHQRSQQNFPEHYSHQWGTPSPGETKEMANVIRRNTEDNVSLRNSGPNQPLLKSGDGMEMEGGKSYVPVDASWLTLLQ